jgi:eukaryotic-like serine/threonine-protein kinase
MTLTPGTRLGSYEIVSGIGAGGMGEVYRARDTKLQRDIAIKVLPAIVQGDAAAAERFRREARAIAALNHPNIVTIHSVEEVGARVFIAMELVVGATLAELIPPDGLPLEAVLQYAIPLADAISAAHASGVSHRDLKPSNVMIGRDGRLKVLDFGLAKLTGDTAPVAATVTRDFTGAGQIVGTVAYMSPEQASGAPCDARTDLFSLGVMLYEMSTGRRPFTGESSVSVLAAILKDTPPPVTSIRPALPREFNRIVKRALAKDPEGRYQTAKDLRNDLQTLRDDVTSGELGTVAAPAPVSRTRRPWIAPAVVGVVCAAAATYLVFTKRVPPAADAPEAATTIARLTSTGKASLAAVSPDGKYVIHVVSNPEHSLWVRQTATGGNVQVLPSSNDVYIGLTFSPDGDYIYYTRFLSRVISVVERMPVLGGAPQQIIRDADSAVAFAPDGSRIAFIRGEPRTGIVKLMVAKSDGSDQTVLSTGPLVGGYPLFGALAWSPDGRSIAVPFGGFTLLGGQNDALITIVDASTGARRDLTTPRWRTVSGLAWLRSGTLVVSGTEPGKPNDQLWRIAANGSVRRLTNDLNSYRGASASNTGTIATVLGDFSSTLSVSRVNAPSALSGITAGGGRYEGQLGLTWTPDGKLVYTSGVTGQIELWMSDADGTNARALTSNSEIESDPAVSPDGRAIVYKSGSNRGLATLDLVSGRIAALTAEASDASPQWADDHTILFTRSGAAPRIFRVGANGGQATDLGLSATTDTISPDGRYVAGLMKPENETVFVGVAAVDGSREMKRFDILSIPIMIRWSPRGDSLTYLESRRGPQSLWTQPLSGGAAQKLLDLHGERIFRFAWSRDGRLAAAHGPAPTDVVLISRIE